MILETFGTFISKIMLFSAYVREASHFPEPLSKEEEAKYLTLAREGDESAKEVLVERNLRLVAHIVKKFQNAGEADDLISIGTIGLIKAVGSFDPSKQVMLSTFAARCIENEILMNIRSNKKHITNVSLEEALSSDKEGNELTYFDTLAMQEPALEDIVMRNFAVEDVIKTMKKTLSDKEYRVIILRYGLLGNRPHAQREVADLLGISRSYISRIEQKAINQIQTIYKAQNINEY